ncbi:hypothetical protein K4K57_009810 [Colletotrichum sp. SAR 10_99]|nr:hypothetical protein K4K56_002993 [Colletotrichum sp. SAR 10_98]KAJ5008836.1 hypothetical protein K4K57_009810 [Colletotrichum sp. SAR 10_99]
MLSSKITFGIHSDNLVCLLRRMRLAETQTDLQKAFGYFKTYVIVSSCDKMSTRLYRGGKPTAPTNKAASDTKKQPTKSGEQATPPDKKRKFFVTLTSNDAKGAQSLGGRFLPPDIKPLNAQQLRSMKRIVSFLKTHGKINTLENYPPANTKNWYGIQGRLCFQTVLAALLSGFAKSLDRLVAFKKECHRTQTAFLKKTPGAKPADDAYLLKLIINTNYWMTHLDLFREMFSATIFPAHFNWLEAIARPQDGQRLRPGSPLEERYANDAPSGGSEEHNEDDGSFAEEEAQDTELADLDEIALTSWSKAGIAYINLLMLHAQGISSLGRYDVKEKGGAKQISSIIMSKAGFRLLIVKPEFEDRAMAPLEDVLGRV